MPKPAADPVAPAAPTMEWCSVCNMTHGIEPRPCEGGPDEEEVRVFEDRNADGRTALQERALERHARMVDEDVSGFDFDQDPDGDFSR